MVHDREIVSAIPNEFPDSAVIVQHGECAAMTGLALRTHDKEQEEEAGWLAGCLMLPREVLLHIKTNGLTDEAACRHYGVSAKMLTYRMNISGVNLQHKRAQVWRR